MRWMIAPVLTVFVSATVWASIGPVDSDADGLSDDWERGVGRYEVVLGTFNWHEACQDAARRGGYPATIVSPLEWQSILRILGPELVHKNLWLGGTDDLNEGQWRWVTDEPWGIHLNWRQGEPNNSTIGNAPETPSIS